MIRSDGLQAIIFDANVWLENPIPGARTAILDLPKEYEGHYDAIVFYFEDPTPLADIEAVVRSVRIG